MKKFLKNLKLSIPTLGVVAGLLAWLAFGYFGIHRLFIDDVVDEAAPAQLTTEATGTFVSLDHSTSGGAVVLGGDSGQRFLRFEDLDTSNGPDLNVYLVNSSTGDVSDLVDLGDLKGNLGDQNYEIPADVDLAIYDTVVIWCVRFSSAFGQAELRGP